MHKHYDGMPGMTAPATAPDPKKASAGAKKAPTQATNPRQKDDAPTSVSKAPPPKVRKP